MSVTAIVRPSVSVVRRSSLAQPFVTLDQSQMIVPKPRTDGVLPDIIPSTVPLIDGLYPSLYVDFVNGVYLYHGVLYSSFTAWLAAIGGTFTRASVRTVRTNVLASVASGALGIEYDTSAVAIGALIEESRTNFALRSEEFDNASWTTTNATVSANAASSPAGSATADKLNDNTTNGSHYVSQAMTPVVGTYTLSVYGKAAERSWLVLQINCGGINSYRTFNLSNGTVGSTGTVAGTIESEVSGYYRCSITATTISTGAGFIRVWVTTSDSISVYVGNGTGIYIWGAQFELGGAVSSYIPTTGSTATRAADVLKLGAGAVSAGPFTLYAKARQRQQDTGPYVLQAYKDANNRVALYVPTGTPTLRDIIGGAVVADIAAATWGAGVTRKWAARVKTNDVNAAFNGVAGTADTSCAIPDPVANVHVGSNDGANGFWNGHIAEIGIWSGVGQSDANLQSLTT